MKTIKTIFAFMAVWFGPAATLVSCSDEKEPETAAARSVEATYTGNLTCSVMGDEELFNDKTLTVVATDDAHVTVTIPSFGNAPMELPEIEVDGVKVTEKDGRYALGSTTFAGTTAGGKAYSGTLHGELADNMMTIRFNLQYGAMPMPLICTFSAQRQ